MNTSYVIIGILGMAAITYIPRVLPLIVFKKRMSSKRLQTFLKYMPLAVLGAMTFPSILTSTGNIIVGSVGCCLALVLAYFERSLLMVTILTVLGCWVLGLIL